MVAGDFHKLFEERNIRFDGSCSSSLEAIIFGVCDYLKQIHSNPAACARQGPLPHLQTPLLRPQFGASCLRGCRSTKTSSRYRAKWLRRQSAGPYSGLPRNGFTVQTGGPLKKSFLLLCASFFP